MKFIHLVLIVETQLIFFWLKIKEGKKIKINTLDFYPIIPKDYYQFKKHFEEFIEHNKPEFD